MGSDRFSSPDERKASARRERTSDATGAAETTVEAPHPLLSLQRQIGNAQVARMLAQRQPASVQRDPAEDDEDEVQMMRDPRVQRAASAEEENELQMQRAELEVGLEGGPISDDLAGRIQARRGNGAVLDERSRGAMEESFGTSFEDVRVHTDGESGAISRSLGAKAFTTGSDIFFGEGAQPGDTSLLAHELTHVVQQRSMSGGGRMHVGPADDSYEREADSVAAAVTTGASSAQRQEEE